MTGPRFPREPHTRVVRSVPTPDPCWQPEWDANLGLIRCRKCRATFETVTEFELHERASRRVGPAAPAPVEW